MLTKDFLESLEEIVYDMTFEDGMVDDYCEKLSELDFDKTYKLIRKGNIVIIREFPLRDTLLPRTIAGVRLDKLNSYYVKFDGKMNQAHKYAERLLRLIEEYAKTPLDEREAEKRYYVKVADGSFGYLNYRDGDYGVFEKDNELKKTKFTRSEIAKYLGNDDDKLLDMYIERFCEEVE